MPHTNKDVCLSTQSRTLMLIFHQSIIAVFRLTFLWFCVDQDQFKFSRRDETTGKLWSWRLAPFFFLNRLKRKLLATVRIIVTKLMDGVFVFCFVFLAWQSVSFSSPQVHHIFCFNMGSWTQAVVMVICMSNDKTKLVDTW